MTTVDYILFALAVSGITLVVRPWAIKAGVFLSKVPRLFRERRLILSGRPFHKDGKLWRYASRRLFVGNKPVEVGQIWNTPRTWPHPELKDTFELTQVLAKRDVQASLDMLPKMFPPSYSITKIAKSYATTTTKTAKPTIRAKRQVKKVK